MDNDDLLEPLKCYNNILKDDIVKNATDYYNELLMKSGVSEDQNQQTVAKYKDFKKKADKAINNTNKMKGIKTFLVILTVVFFIVAVVFIVNAFTKSLFEMKLWLSIILGASCLVCGVILVLITIKKVNSEIKKRLLYQQQMEQKRDSYLNEAKEQVKPLMELMDWNMPAKVITKTVPLLQLDPYFDMTKFDYFAGKYGLEDVVSENVSEYFSVSGSILGNPFLVEREYLQEMESKVYTGTLQISWTERVRNANGGSSMVTRTQTLTASVTKPAPAYHYSTVLVYGNDAAPNLSFSREPSKVSKKSTVEQEKMVKREYKKLEKQAAKDLNNKDSHFRPMENKDFDVLFHATDRDNEVEFRLLFTPLSQKNELDLIKGEGGYGDDFFITKKGPLNYVQSYHSQKLNIYSNPSSFYNYEILASRNLFVEYTSTYFKALYFDLAPLLAIPLYQQQKTKEYIYQTEYERNFTSFEAESLANAFDVSVFDSPDAKTDTILKSVAAKKCGLADNVTISANSFNAINRVDYINVHGGDGRIHAVPVHWVEYLPVSKKTQMVVKKYNVSRNEFDSKSKDPNFIEFMNNCCQKNSMIFQRGLFAFIPQQNYDVEMDNALNKILGKERG